MTGETSAPSHLRQKFILAISTRFLAAIDGLTVNNRQYPLNAARSTIDILNVVSGFFPTPSNKGKKPPRYGDWRGMTSEHYLRWRLLLRPLAVCVCWARALDNTRVVLLLDCTAFCGYLSPFLSFSSALLPPSPSSIKCQGQGMNRVPEGVKADGHSHREDEPPTSIVIHHKSETICLELTGDSDNVALHASGSFSFFW